MAAVLVGTAVVVGAAGWPGPQGLPRSPLISDVNASMSFGRS
jgi:hypothetical protein